jgi:hypothetical protein
MGKLTEEQLVDIEKGLLIAMNTVKKGREFNKLNKAWQSVHKKLFLLRKKQQQNKELKKNFLVAVLKEAMQ